MIPKHILKGFSLPKKDFEPFKATELLCKARTLKASNIHEICLETPWSLFYTAVLWEKIICYTFFQEKKRKSKSWKNFQKSGQPFLYFLINAFGNKFSNIHEICLENPLVSFLYCCTFRNMLYFFPRKKRKSKSWKIFQKLGQPFLYFLINALGSNFSNIHEICLENPLVSFLYCCTLRKNNML